MKYNILSTGSSGNCLIINEIWKDVKDFEDKYAISNYGRIKNKLTNHIYKLTNKNGDYFRIILYDKNKSKTCLIHRLVAEIFIPNPNNKPQVDHIDGNKQNNCVDNLRWVTNLENIKHNIETNKFYYVGYHNKNKVNKKGKIIQFDKNMNKINSYINSGVASEMTGVCSRNILHCANHKEGRKQAGGYIWLYESEVVQNDL